LIARYAQPFTDGLAAVGRTREGGDRQLAAHLDLYADVLRSRRMCLCGMLAAEYQTLP
jgi:TetR/AcrR family transcriptional regulator, transcriptional repressor for nem operon